MQFQIKHLCLLFEHRKAKMKIEYRNVASCMFTLTEMPSLDSIKESGPDSQPSPLVVWSRIREVECGLFPISSISSLCLERKISIFVTRPKANWNLGFIFDRHKILGISGRVAMRDQTAEWREFSICILWVYYRIRINAKVRMAIILTDFDDWQICIVVLTRNPR